MSEKIKGTVKWFNERKGFGFIQSNGKDYFVHFSSIQLSGFKTLEEGDKVLFKYGNGQKGLCAEEVQVVD
ncbi:stress protein, member of the CspA-family [Legionella santicrucis]|uniref:Stress protein, member of the CspA-family n=1 Tax=Legionella santicrucis TaxID=45074 RepID=A0A0W0Y9C8_9GAMM|nr:cold-shock protein [Legionella santicrucis]KTD53266.1 stress protein, member of the CspA-family [Legionella santicrucis]